MAYCLTSQDFQGGVIIHPAVLDDAAVAVVRIFTETEVSHNDHLRQSILDGGNSPLDDAVFCKRATARGIFLIRDSKKNHRGYAQVPEFL